MISKRLLSDVIQACRALHERRLWKRFNNSDCIALRIPSEEHLLLTQNHLCLPFGKMGKT